MAIRCYECGADGHVSYDCPNKALTSGDGRPMWCGECNQRSRHVTLPDGRVARCRCHPESHKLLSQHRRCPQCFATVVQWDNGDCDRHQLAGVQPAYKPIVRELVIPDLRAEAARQVAEFRAARQIT